MHTKPEMLTANFPRFSVTMGESYLLADFWRIGDISIVVATALSVPTVAVARSNSESRKCMEKNNKKNMENAPAAAAQESFQPRECEFSRTYAVRNKHRLGTKMIREYAKSANTVLKTTTLPL